MQNNPKRSSESKKIRRLLVPEPGWSFLAVDIAQSELRWIAHIANERNMIKIFSQGIDIHSYTAERISGKKLSLMEPEERKTARFHSKALNFGAIYLISAWGFQRHAKKDYGIELSEEGAQEWLDMFLLEMFPGLPLYHRKYLEFCREHEYVESPFGRRRHLPNINSRNNRLRKEAERQSVNAPVQSASSDVVLLCAAELLRGNYLDKNECRVIAFVHDELIFEVRNKDGLIDKYYQRIKSVIEDPPTQRFGFTMRVPLVCDGKVGYENLADMTDI
jgi:DNA polymerase-1